MKSLDGGLRCLRFKSRQEHFSVLSEVQTVSGTHTASCSMGIGFVLPMVDRPAPDVEPSHACSVGIRNNWSHTSAPSIRIHNLETDSFNLYLSNEFSSNLLSLVYQVFICKYVPSKHKNPIFVRFVDRAS